MHSYIPSKSQFSPALMLTSEMLEVNDVPEQGERGREINYAKQPYYQLHKIH